MVNTCIDAFCGAGGLSLGLQKSGFKILHSFDLDPIVISTLRSNKKYFTHNIEESDINDLNTSALLEKLGLRTGELDLFSGGPPCQGFSIQRVGENKDERNSLIYKYIEKVIEISPKFFLMENVPGINGQRGKELLEKALSYANNNGYFIHQKTLNAQDFGIPQRRKRVIIVGERMDYDSPRFSFPMPNGKAVTVRDTIKHLPRPPSNGKDHPDIPHHRKDRLSDLNLERIRFVKEGQGMEYLPEHLLANCHKVGAKKIGHRNVYGRMKWDDVAPTITARFDSFTRGLFGHPEQDRTISLYEGALLQTFPGDFRFNGNKVDIARQIGNAVPPLLAKAIGDKIIGVLNGI